MDSTTDYKIRRALAEHLEEFASEMGKCLKFPAKVKILHFKSYADKTIAKAGFCFRIDAINGDTYCTISEIINNLKTDVARLRKCVATNNWEGNEGAVSATRNGFHRLWGVIYAIKDCSKTVA